MKTSQQNKILNLLDDGLWHCTSEMAALYMVDYRRRLVDLKEKGWQLESRRCTKHPHPMKEWRLNSAPQRDFHPLETELYQTHQTITAAEFLAKFPSKEKTPQAQNSLF